MVIMSNQRFAHFHPAGDTTGDTKRARSLITDTAPKTEHLFGIARKGVAKKSRREQFSIHLNWRPRREWSRRESSDIDEARRVRFRAETESIEAKVKEFPEESHASWITQIIPGGNGAAGKRAT